MRGWPRRGLEQTGNPQSTCMIVGCRKGVLSLPPPPDPPSDIESNEPTEAPPACVWARDYLPAAVAVKDFPKESTIKQLNCRLLHPVATPRKSVGQESPPNPQRPTIKQLGCGPLPFTPRAGPSQSHAANHADCPKRRLSSLQPITIPETSPSKTILSSTNP